MIIKLLCDDRYEAEKLAGLISIQKDGTVYVAGISAVVGNEVVVKLKDKSSHAVVMKDKENVKKLEELIRDVAAGKKTLVSSDFSGATAEITLAD